MVAGDVDFTNQMIRDALYRIEERIIRIEDRSSRYVSKEDLKSLKDDIDADSMRSNVRLDALAKEIDELKAIRDKLVGFFIAVILTGSISGGVGGYIVTLLGNR